MSEQIDRVFNNAMCFVVAYRHMNEMIEPELFPARTIASAIPLFMLGGLTIELLLKTFHMRDHGKIPRSHDLADLYRNLPSATRIAIKKRYKTGPAAAQRKKLFDAIEKTAGSRPSSDLAELLDSASRAFETYRYSYEEPPEGYPDFLLSDLPQLLVDVLVEGNPNWKAWRPTMPKAFEEAAKRRPS
jgi:hypothetical protein